MIAAGGTAGHVYPGLAIADAIAAARARSRVTFIGTPRGIEGAAVPAAGYSLELIEVIPWTKSLGARRFLAPASLAAATATARTLLERLRPKVVIGMGGYASLPVVLAARTKRLAALLHEQNAIPGIANVVGARAVPRVAVSFEETRARFPRSADVRVLGNPIREQIATLDRGALRDAATTDLGLHPARRTLLVTGGSLGALRLNEAALGLAERWRGRIDVQMLVAVGRGRAEEMRRRAAGFSGALRAVWVDYLDRIDLAYAAADVALCRAGATTVAELAAVGLPSVLVPYPYARSNHQEANARALERAGGARVVLDRDADADRVAAVLEPMLSDHAMLRRMSDDARRFGKPRAARDVAVWAQELADAGRRHG